MPVRLLALVALPFLYLPSLVETRELPRLALLCCVGFAALTLAFARGRAQARWQHVCFALAVMLACLLADSPARSFFGPYEGHLGALAWLAYTALLVAPPPRDSLPMFCRALLAVGALQAVMAMVQAWVWSEPPRGTVGHPMFLASLCMVTAVVAAGRILDATTRSEKALAHLAGWLAIAGMLAAARRGPVLGLVIAASIVAVWHPRRQRLAVFGSVCAVAALLLGAVAAHEGVWSRIAGSATYDSALQRLDFARVALQAMWERPLAGWGFGAFGDLYAAGKLGGFDPYEIHVHNVWLEMGTSAGLLGLVGLLLVVGAAISQCRRVVRGPKNTEISGTLLACSAAAAAYLVHLSFNLDEIAVGAWVWTLTGCALAAPGRALGIEMKRGLRAALAVGSASLALVAVVPLAADYSMGAALDAEKAPNPNLGQATHLFEKAIARAPYECTYRLRYATFLRHNDPSGTTSRRLEHLGRCLELEPRSAYLHYHAGLAHEDSGDLARARASFTDAIKRAPTYFLFHQALGRTQARDGQLQQAMLTLDEAIRLAPREPGPLNTKGNVLLMLGRDAEASKLYRQALKVDPGNDTARYNLELTRSTDSP